MTTMNNKISLPPISDILNHQPASNLTYHIPQYHLPNYYSSQPPRPVLPPTSSYAVLPTAPQSHVITGQAYGGARVVGGPHSTAGHMPVSRHYSFNGSSGPALAPVRPPMLKLSGVGSETSHSSIATSPIRSAETSPKFSKASSDEPKDGKRKTRNNLPKETTYILLKWLNEHLNHPYPNSFEKNQLMLLTGLNQQQLSNWFINARRRKIKLLKDQKRMAV